MGTRLRKAPPKDDRRRRVPKFRADFIVKCSLVLPDDTPAVISLDSPPMEITLRNAVRNAEGHVPELIGQVVGDCASIEDVGTTFREVLISQLDLLTFEQIQFFLLSNAFAFWIGSRIKKVGE
jgi:hypothetical protein